MASRRASSRLSKSLIGATATAARLSHSHPRSVRPLSSYILRNSLPSSSRPRVFGGGVSDSNVASAKFLANTFTRHFHASNPSFYSASNGSQVPIHTILDYLVSFIHAFIHTQSIQAKNFLCDSCIENL